MLVDLSGDGAIGADDFMAALNANMLTPITLMSRLLPTMIEKGWGRVVILPPNPSKRRLRFLDCQIQHALD